MIKEVFKKGGKREIFDPEKIKKAILSALSETDLDEKKKKEIGEKVFSNLMEFLKGKEEIFTAEIEAKILLELEKLAPKAAANWREHRRKKQE